MIRPPPARLHASAVRLSRAGLALFGLTLAAGACLDRPVAPAAPRTSNAITEEVAIEQINKIDLLFMVDNSISMADKQVILARAVPDLLTRLITPNCVGPDGRPIVVDGKALTVDAMRKCSQGSPEFNAVADIHIGVISSSLGGHGGNLCTPDQPGLPAGHPIDNARLLTRGRDDKGVDIPQVPTFKNLGFLAWDQTGDLGGETNPDTLAANFANIVRGVGQDGCGFEASLESWYRFLVDPSPPKLELPPLVDPNKPDGGRVSTAPVLKELDTALLEERVNFLRPDSLVAIIALSDENDCSFIDGFYPRYVRGDNGLVNGNGAWPDSYLKRLVTNTPNGPIFFDASFRLNDQGQTQFEQGTAKCQDDPFSPECFNCGYLTDPAARTAAGCDADPAASKAADTLNLRCFDQRKRFGWEALHPVQRYIDGLTQKKVYDTSGAQIALNKPAPGVDDAKYFIDDNPNARDAGKLVAPKVDNPLFVDLPWRRYLATCTGEGDARRCDETIKPKDQTNELRGRPDGRIYFAGIVGVPWQDVANNPETLQDTTNPDGSARPGGFQSPATINWNLILGNPDKLAPPADPLMREAIGDRLANEANKLHPITQEPLGATGWNRINGHEWEPTGRDDLQYACIFPLPNKPDNTLGDLQCLVPGAPEGSLSCDCDQANADQANDPTVRHNPLCETYDAADPTRRGTGTFTTIQARAKAYPGLRHLEVLKGIGEAAIVASICPEEVQNVDQGNYGYRPAVNTIIDRLKNALKGRCLPRRLDVQDNKSPCLVIEAKYQRNTDGTQPAAASEISSCQLCNAPGYAPLRPELLATLQGQDVTQYDCLCEFQQLEGTAQQTCQTDATDPGLIPNINGWCYVDPAFAPDPDTRTKQTEIVKNCPADAQRTLRFIGTQSATGGSAEKTSIFITCLGAASNSPISSGSGGSSGAGGASGAGGEASASNLGPGGGRRAPGRPGRGGHAPPPKRPMPKKTILMIEDEPHIVLGLKDALEFEGFRVVSAALGREGVTLARQESPDAIVLDLMLPDVNGYQVCEELRRFDAFVPILMLTARSQEADKIRGLDAGADDYVTKPFSVGELIARLRALLRRAARSADPSHGRFRLGECEVDLVSHEVARGDKREQLSFYEVELLRFLHERAGQPVARDEILSKVWGVSASGTNRTVDNFIVKLRRKVEADHDKPRHILTVYGYGYKLVP